ncbi:MAG TPA: sigma-70 family RNA polymerase sigma factor [Pyrinomonadaceae bacterium]|nr:sigma-70 family RNA polymerase sigma factor [Pyrinomonadaceae bacterium]
MSTLTTSSFQLLLDRLDNDPTKYEELRVRIVQLLRWRGCPESHVDELVDKTFDRVASKLASGEQVENIGAFAAAVARFIWLEHTRKNRTDAVGDDLPETPVEPDLDFLDDEDARMRCLRRCVATKFSDEDKRLVVAYYDTDADEKAKTARKRLAESLGMTLNVLKVRACRLRMKLERCINDCVAGVTNSTRQATTEQEVTS